MKIKVLLTWLLTIAFAASAGWAQIAKPLAEDLKSSEKTIRNSPFSAEAVTESVQILFDGTKIVRKTLSKLYRDNEGRLRREDSKTRLGVGGDEIEIDESIRIVDPVAGVKYELDVETRTFEKKSTPKKMFDRNKDSMFTKQSEWSIKGEMSSEKKADNNEKQSEDQARKREKQEENRKKQEENRAKQEEERIKLAEKTGMRPVDKPPGPAGTDQPFPLKSSPEGQTSTDKDGTKKKTESLGVQTVQGVVTEGTRTTTTIPVGTIGNDRDINVVYEKWYSKELQMTVLSKHTDPRFGEQTYRLSNISRKNQPISLFVPPADYKDDGDGDGDGDGDNDGRKKKPRVPAKPSPPKMTAKPPAIGKPAGPMPKMPLI